MSSSSIMHFGTPTPAAQAVLDDDGVSSVPTPKSVLSNDMERAAGRDKAMTYAIAIAKEGETTPEKLIEDSRAIYEFLYMNSTEDATAA